MCIFLPQLVMSFFTEMATGYFTYNPSWEFEFPTFKRSSLSCEHGYCIACRLDISVTKGRKTLEKHILCKRHISSLAVNCMYCGIIRLVIITYGRTLLLATTSIGRELEINRQRIDQLAKGVFLKSKRLLVSLFAFLRKRIFPWWPRRWHYSWRIRMSHKSGSSFLGEESFASYHLHLSALQPRSWL